MFALHTLLIHASSSRGSQDEPQLLCFSRWDVVSWSSLGGFWGVPSVQEGIWLPLLCAQLETRGQCGLFRSCFSSL